MASDAKVGLIAGLTFIICFAVILSNRGSREFLRENQVRSARAVVARSGDWQIRSRLSTSRPLAAPGADQTEAPAPAQGGEPKATQRGQAGAGPAVSHAGSGRAPYQEENADARAERALPGMTGALETTSATRYKVVSGDTLSQIAAAHYGRRSSHLVRAIFEANRSVLSSPDLLRPGVELVIPIIEKGSALSAAVTASVGDGDAVDARSRGGQHGPEPRRRGPFRLYKIRKNDRYISIAREQLGDARRWPEIYELNRDEFPDPGTIRAGAEIRLPIQVMADSTGRRQ